MPGIDLYWLPLGAGGHSVRLNGRIFEWVAARLAHRDRCDLYHSALEVHVPEGRFVIEQAPAWSEAGERGVVAEGPVGIRTAGRLRLFRYEIRRWRDGVIPDITEAVESPQRLSGDAGQARHLLELVPQVPTPVWGRDELQTGEMWNSNSLISWLITRSDLDLEGVRLPERGRAPGWHAGIVLATRQMSETARPQTPSRARRQIGQADQRGASGHHSVCHSSYVAAPCFASLPRAVGFTGSRRARSGSRVIRSSRASAGGRRSSRAKGKQRCAHAGKRDVAHRRRRCLSDVREKGGENH